MIVGANESPRINERFLHGLHVFYAAFFGLVLPFICLGAQATPGHPHAFAHFVFVAPTLAQSAIPGNVDAATWLASGGHSALCTSQSATGAAERSSDTLPLAPGRSAPTLMISGLLLLVVFVTPLLAPGANRPTIVRKRESVPPFLLELLVPTPPPR
jgi:hypothetical protein